MQKTNREHLKELLRNGPVSFSFTKVDGSLREATGTLNQQIITSKLGEKPFEDNERINTERSSLTYFDLEKEAWRSISKDSEIYI